MLATLALLATPALAQQAGHQGMNHQGMDHSKMMQPTAANPYGPAEMDMHQKMMAAKGADAGETWIRKMIEHHRGAVAMSQIALRSSQNAEVRGEAQKAITSQNREIATLNAMLRKMGIPALTKVANCRVKIVRPLLLSARPKTIGRDFFAVAARRATPAAADLGTGLARGGRAAGRRARFGVVLMCI